jgi:phage baseplate assembly protein W
MNMRKFKGFSTVGKTWGNFTLYDVNLAKQNILNEFYTRKGERVMSPTFGSIVWDLLFDPLTDDTVQLIKDDSQRIVTKDPRLELQDIRVEEEEHTIRVIILLNYIPSATLTELVATFNRDIATSIQQG